VTPLSRAAVAVGADGLIVEVHHDPDRALSDGMQSLYPDQFDALMVQVRQIAAVLGRSIPKGAEAATLATTSTQSTS
jgi:3-deoxy-7-phosphoheptulonate synthase